MEPTKSALQKVISDDSSLQKVTRLKSDTSKKMTKKVNLDGDGDGKIMLEKHKKQTKMPPISNSNSRPTTANKSNNNSKPTTANNSRPTTASNSRQTTSR